MCFRYQNIKLTYKESVEMKNEKKFLFAVKHLLNRINKEELQMKEISEQVDCLILSEFERSVCDEK